MSLVHLGVGGEWLQIVGTSIHFERLLVYCFSQLHPPRGRVEPTVNNFREREREREREGGSQKLHTHSVLVKLSFNELGVGVGGAVAFIPLLNSIQLTKNNSQG